MNFYLNSVLNAFSAMDSDLLGKLLDSQNTYQEVSLDVFIKRLDDVFSEFKSGGDQRLKVASGFCMNRDCNPNQIRTAYRFYGDVTHNYLDFRFILDITDDLKDYQIADIYECSCLKCREDQNEWFEEKKSLSFYWDELNDFSDDPDYIIHKEVALEAEKEIREEGKKFTVEEIQVWLIKYQSTYDFIRNFGDALQEMMEWDGFRFLYFDLQDLIERVPEIVSLFKLDYYLDDNCSEEELIEKVLKLEDYFFVTMEERNSLIVIIDNMAFLGGYFDEFYKLWDWFKQTQDKLIKKYYAFTESQEEIFLKQKYYDDPKKLLTQLGYHLQWRKQVKEMGINIPLNLRGD